MKVCLLSRLLTALAMLYIPHGSDESYYYDKFILYFFLGFISHMVQMKAPSLLARLFCWLIFISHMVQMKEMFIHREAGFRI